ncbi:ectonucleotide pyrophosphatase/phosphodiesterase [Sphingomonas sp.]|uniref:alkaline phosphatase family protein n=1 Tax=Sphingomonas sp. TaxID=28214 RepID=UPI003CC55DF1
MIGAAPDTNRRRPFLGAALTTTLLLGACAYPYTPPALPPVTASAPYVSSAAEQRTPVTILISIDGFRPDYLERGVTPVLNELARAGTTGPMVPSFPSKTFPNHWTLVTGLTPDHHGVVANRMEDAARPGETFTMATDDPFWWNTAAPIWVTAEQAGIRTAAMFWPGSNVAWGGRVVKGENDDLAQGGVRPSDWHQFAQALTGAQRVDAVIDWFRRPAATRPRFVTLYFDSVDTAGHDHGPDAAEVTAAAADVDGWIGHLRTELATLGQPANLVIVADHGMAATSSARTIALDRIADPADYRVLETGPYATFYPVAGHEARLAAALLRPHPHMSCWRKQAIPARLAYGANPRIPPFLCLAEVGWLTTKTTPTKAETGGNHGYDNGAPEMRALFIANGPAFRAGVRVGAFPNTDIAPLLRDVLGLPAGANLDGDDAPFRSAMRR